MVWGVLVKHRFEQMRQRHVQSVDPVSRLVAVLPMPMPAPAGRQHHILANIEQFSQYRFALTAINATKNAWRDDGPYQCGSRTTLAGEVDWT